MGIGPFPVPGNFEGTLVFDGTTGGNGGVVNASYASSCGEASMTGPGFWLYVDGSNSIISVDTCHSKADTQIGVFSTRSRTTEGESANCNLSCIEGNDNRCGKQSKVEWLASTGVRYYVFVHVTDPEDRDYVHVKFRPKEYLDDDDNA